MSPLLYDLKEIRYQSVYAYKTWSDWHDVMMIVKKRFRVIGLVLNAQ